jgi:hypothetical protein
MNVTYELVVRGERAQLERLLARVEGLLRDGWTRNHEAEERASRDHLRGSSDYCFECAATADRPAASFWVRPRGSKELYVSHVIALDRPGLPAEESRGVLAEFRREFLDPVGEGLGVETEIVEHRRTVEQDLSPEARRLLRTFSASANRQGLGRDGRRLWNAFLVQLHREEAYFDVALLDEWLAEEGWPEATRRQLLGEYETGMSLLAAYDEGAARR